MKTSGKLLASTAYIGIIEPGLSGFQKQPSKLVLVDVLFGLCIS